MTQTPSANDVLMGGGGAPAFKFDQPGVTLTGRIVAISQPYQEREYDKDNPGGGAPKFYPKSGDPIMTFSLDVVTALRDPSIEDDDGTRRVYMDGKRIKDAVRGGVRAAGAPGLEVGGQLTVQYVSDDVPGDHRSGKNYAVQYVAPVAKANDVLMGAPAAAPAPATQPVPAGWNVPPVTPAPAFAQPAPAQVPSPVPPFAQPAPTAPAAVVPSTPAPVATAPNEAQLAAFAAWQASQAVPQPAQG